jgi:rhodanese-related sulfurtransferase
MSKPAYGFGISDLGFRIVWCFVLRAVGPFSVHFVCSAHSVVKTAVPATPKHRIHGRHGKGLSANLGAMQHSDEFLAIVEDAKSRVKEVSVDEALNRMNDGAKLIDVREDNEWDDAHAAGAKHMGRGVLERDIVQTFPGKDTELILYCGGGYRSALATDMLQKMGYSNVWSMAGGWKAWKDAGGPIE